MSVSMQGRQGARPGTERNGAQCLSAKSLVGATEAAFDISQFGTDFNWFQVRWSNVQFATQSLADSALVVDFATAVGGAALSQSYQTGLLTGTSTTMVWAVANLAGVDIYNNATQLMESATATRHRGMTGVFEFNRPDASNVSNFAWKALGHATATGSGLIGAQGMGVTHHTGQIAEVTVRIGQVSATPQSGDFELWGFKTGVPGAF